MKRILTVILSAAAVSIVLPAFAADEEQPFFYEARVINTNSLPLTGLRTFRLLAEVDGRNFTSDVVAVELGSDGVARVPFLVKGVLPDFRRATCAHLSALVKVREASPEKHVDELWERVGPVQRLGSAAAALVADDVLMLTNDQAIAVSSDLTLETLNVSGTLTVGDARPLGIANPPAVELGDASGRMTVEQASVRLDRKVNRVIMMSGPYPATNRVAFGDYIDLYGNFAQVSFVTGDASPWNSNSGRICCMFTAPCDCIYEIQMRGAMGTPTADQQKLWNANNATQQGRVFLGLTTPDGLRWRAPFDSDHGFSAQGFQPKSYTGFWYWPMQASRKWLAGTEQDQSWGMRDNALQIPMMRGETFYAEFFIGPVVVVSGALDFIKTSADHPHGLPLHGLPEGAAPDTWMRASFNYYPLSAD